MAGRPKIPRKTCCSPECTCFKPVKSSNRKSVVSLLPDEIDALNFCDKEQLDQKEAAKKMKVSQSTMARILLSARTKLATAIIDGVEIRLG